MNAKRSKSDADKDAYAIIKSGGKQYKVKEGDVINVELLEAEIGSEIHFDEVLFIGESKGFQVGSPGVKGYKVKGEILNTVAGPKISSIKYKPSHNQVRKFGHRQHYTQVKIVGIAKH